MTTDAIAPARPESATAATGPIYIIGHKNPDADSICSAIAYAAFKAQRGETGYVAARYDGHSPEECLAYGVACGAESTQHFGAGTVDRNQVERLLGEVSVHDLEVPAEV